MRWKFVVAGLALAVAGTVGCKQQCFMTECDYRHYQDHVGLPANLDTKTDASIHPRSHDVPPPATVLYPEREIRNMSLAEAIAIALEQGTTGVANFANPGQASDQIGQGNALGGGSVNVTAGNDNIRVLALAPAIAAADVEASLSKFDARWTSSLTWNQTDRPVGTVLDTFQAFGRANSIQNTDSSLQTGIVKPLPTGGVAGITFRTDYQLSNLNPRINPSYRPTLQFAFDQPLLQGFGVEINQLRAAHPGVTQGSLNTPFSPGGRVPGILITRLTFDVQRAQFEVNVATMLLNVEAAYWNLYSQYWNLYSREQALRQAFEAWKISKARFDAGRIPVQDFAQTRLQYELFRSQRITALGQVLEAERQLRGLLGMQVEDGHRIVPVDMPTLAPYQPDWVQALHETMNLRPELVQARTELKSRQLEIINVKNLLLPDLRFFSSYDVNGIGTRLDSPDGNNAFRSLASTKFNNYGLGLRMEVPLGFRDANAQVRQARLALARTYYALQDQELKAERFLALQFRRLFEFHMQIQANRAQREAAALQLEARFKQFQAGQGTLDILLEAQRFWADALREEYSAISNYNTALAGFEFAKGTLLKHDNVVISEGPLPQCAQVRAVEHERERCKGLVLLERAKPVCADPGTSAALPALPTDGAPSIPAVLAGTEKMMPVPDRLPVGPDTAPPSRRSSGFPSLTPAAKTSSLPAKEQPAALPQGLDDKGPALGKPTDALLDSPPPSKD